MILRNGLQNNNKNNSNNNTGKIIRGYNVVDNMPKNKSKNNKNSDIFFGGLGIPKKTIKQIQPYFINSTGYKL